CRRFPHRPIKLDEPTAVCLDRTSARAVVRSSYPLCSFPTSGLAHDISPRSPKGDWQEWGAAAIRGRTEMRAGRLRPWSRFLRPSRSSPLSIADISLLSALLAGALSFLSPCALPLVPPYLCYMAGISVDQF